jgi:hypothetical protein
MPIVVDPPVMSGGEARCTIRCTICAAAVQSTVLASFEGEEFREKLEIALIGSLPPVTIKTESGRLSAVANIATLVRGELRNHGCTHC